MLLKRVEKDGEIKSLFESSTIIASTYEKGTRDLTIIFKNGGKYKYPQVAERDYFRFEISDSQGKTFNDYIKDKYTFDKLDTIDPIGILDSITEAKNENKKSVGLGIMKLMGGFLDGCSKDGELPANYQTVFDALNVEVNKYKSA
jgi:hypothetical protein